MQKLDLNESLGMALILATKSLERLADAKMKTELGLTSSQWKIILALNFIEGQTQKEIAEKIYSDSSTLVPIIDKMVQNGLVERRVDPNDRRNNRIYLTKKAGNVVDAIVDIVINMRKIAYKGITNDELKLVRTILDKITANSENAIKTQKQSAP
ncbi:MAG: MarR family transcriptional regulator [Nitrososphaera sp.]|jgi:MarR family transcriptional regulator for hemolysin